MNCTFEHRVRSVLQEQQRYSLHTSSLHREYKMAYDCVGSLGWQRSVSNWRPFVSGLKYATCSQLAHLICRPVLSSKRSI